MKIELIPANEADRSFFQSVHHIAYRAVIEAMFGWDESFQDEAANSEFRKCNPHIIAVDGRAIGVLGWQLREDHLWFGPIYILPKFQNRGIGATLIRKFMNQAINQGLPMKLRTLRKNEGATKLYERLGFTISAVTEVHVYMQYAPRCRLKNYQHV